jgi:serine/threonine-protein kinase
VTNLKAVLAHQHLGRYEIVAKIGGGGMASIYIGRDVEADAGELVALKVIRDEYVDDERYSTMFIDEAKILAQLSHPNVIRTLEYGITGRHRFIAMELLSGRTFADAWFALEARVEMFSPQLVAWICARVAEGLHAAHELVDSNGTRLNVIHRDVNPANIFLTHKGEVKLIDFGLAKATIRSSKTLGGIVKGKIPYLAPEQARGQPIDRRVDIYALGATLWEASTMKRLFKRDTDIDTLNAIRDAVVPDVRKLVANFPEALWKIIDRATQVRRDDRYPTAEAMRADLDAFVGDGVGRPQELSNMLARLFPGHENEYANWLSKTFASRPEVKTIQPPSAVPTASSSVLDNTDDVSDIRQTIPSMPAFSTLSATPITPVEPTAQPDRPVSRPSAIDSQAPKLRPVPILERERLLVSMAHERSPQHVWLPPLIIVVVVVVLALILATR